MTTPTPKKKSKEGLAIGLAVLIGALVAGAGSYWWTTRGADTAIDAGGVIDDTGPEAQPEPSTTNEGGDEGDSDASDSVEGGDEADSSDGEVAGTEPDNDDQVLSEQHAACPPGTDAVICDAAAFVETQRGRAFKTFPLVELSDPEEFERRLLADFDDYASELAADGDTMRALGLIPADADLVELFRETLSVGVVGFYDTETQELVIKGSTLDLYAELVIVHELTHAFDDQWFDLDRPAFDDLDDDASYGITAVIEGNASRVEAAWRNGLSREEAAGLNAAELSQFTPEDAQRYFAIPEFILNLQISPYTDGEVFVHEIAIEGGEAAVDDLFENPPRSSEQALHINKFRADEAPIELPPIEVPGDVIDEGPLGEIVIREWLGHTAAHGWGGDSYVTWDAGEGQVCIDARFATDSDNDFDELVGALDDWASAQASRTVETNDGIITVTGCN